MSHLARSISAPLEHITVSFGRSETDSMLDCVEDPSQHRDEAIQDLEPGKTSSDSNLTKKTDSGTTDSERSFARAHRDVNDQNIASEGNGCGRGIVRDVRRTIGTHWAEEMSNLNCKTFAVSFFLFFACMAPAITFGAVYAKATRNWIGAVEMITATAWCGITYSLIGGQPMMINGGTGPILAFAEILYSMSESLGVPFLTFNAWVGLWVAFFMVVSAFFGLNRILFYATRFTDEIFALLISTIFIINALKGVFYYFDSDHQLHESYEDDPGYNFMATALLSLILCIGTVQLAFQLRKIKFSPYLPNQILRNAVTDFSVVGAVATMTILANIPFQEVSTETLNVPKTFAPTFSCCSAACDSNWPIDCPELERAYGQRPWLVDLADLNGQGWIPLMAAGPGVLAFILVFLDDGITWHLLNSPSNKLTHGHAYDYDTVLIGIMIAINSMLGLPWLVAATVRSLNHVNAMAEKSPDGTILAVQETRLTNLFVHAMCLGSIFALNLLQFIPMPVLYGVFLYMGLISLTTNQFWGRIQMFGMQPSKYPIHPYTLHMRPRRMHLFTVIQLLLFALLYVVKATKMIAIMFPIVIAFCIPIRLWLLPRIFATEELIMIDTDDETAKKWLQLHRDDEGEEDEANSVFQETPHGEDVDEHQREEQHPASLDGQENVSLAGAGPSAIATPTTAPPETRPRGGRVRFKPSSCPSPATQGVSVSTEQAVDEQKEERRSRHQRRKKSISCPSPEHAMFSESPTTATTLLPGARLTMVQEAHNEMDAEDGDQEEVVRRIRRRRTKQVSCPTHMLLQEAERNVAENYFFG